MATMTLACNAQNDLYLVDGRNLGFLTGEDACAQNLQQKCQMVLGENQYNTADGVDYFGLVFTPQPDYDLARDSLESNILECPDTLSIPSLTISTEYVTNPNSGLTEAQFAYQAQVSTIYGTVPLTNASTFNNSSVQS
jgi:hypothetical protein